MSESNTPPKEQTHIVVDWRKRKTEIEAAAIKKRHDIIKLIIDNIQRSGGHYTAFIILKELEKHGIYVDRSTVSRDLSEIEPDNNFLIDMMKFRYSATIEQCWIEFERIAQEAIWMYSQKWTNNKIIKKYTQGEDGEQIATEEVVTQEIAGPKNDALRIWLDATNSKMKVFNGGVVDTSIALATKNIMKMKAELETLRKEKKVQDEKMKEFKKRLGIQDHETELLNGN